ncbi:MAG: hypothetical protein WDW38_010522 [Sanguina aurantia]
MEQQVKDITACMAAKRLKSDQHDAAVADAQLKAAVTQKDLAGAEKLEADTQQAVVDAHANVAAAQAEAVKAAGEAASARDASVGVRKKDAAAQATLEEAQRQAAAAREDLDLFTATLQPLKRSLAATRPSSEESRDGTSSEKRVKTGQPFQQVFTVTSDDLTHVLRHMSAISDAQPQ